MHILSIVFLILFILVIIFLIISAKQRSKISRLLKSKSKTILYRNILISTDDTTAIGIDETNQKIYYLDASKNIIEYGFSDLMDGEVQVDGKKIKTSTLKSQIGASIGYAVGGTPGLILGAIAGVSKDKVKIKHIRLELQFNKSGIYESHTITLFDGGFLSFDADSPQVKGKLDEAGKWADKVNHIIHNK